MKKLLLLGTVFSLAAAANAAEPVVLPEFYSLTMSPDGKFIVGETEYCSIYDVEKDVVLDYLNSAVGNGNAVAANGLTVGTMMEKAVLMKNGEELTPSTLEGYTLSYLHGITPDAKRVCGLVDNPENAAGYDGMMYLPFYADVDAQGNVGEPVILPFPTKDYTGLTPQYSSAVWISDDGKTIVGQLVDYSGSFLTPIVYTQDEKGEWFYNLPAESLLNPNHLEFPKFPGEFTLSMPQVTDYMTAEQAAAYNEAMEAYYASGYNYELYPNAADYMTAEKAEEYNKAADAYNEAAMKYNEELRVYYEKLDEINAESVGFEQNAMTLSPDGKLMAATGLRYEQGDWMPVEVPVNYLFDLEKGTFSVIETAHDAIRICQVFDNGTMIAATPMPSMFSSSKLPPTSYIRLAGADDFMAIDDYIATVNPEGAEWMKENLYHEIEVGYDEENDWAPIYEKIMFTGHVSASRDLTTLAGGVLAYMFSEDYTYETYVMKGLTSGIETAVATPAAVGVKSLGRGVLAVSGKAASLTVTDLSGRTVYTAAEVSGQISTGLAGGVYVVTVADAAGTAKSVKVVL